MHWFLVDETNRDYSADHFFIVGGLVFTEPQIDLVDAAVREVRQAYGYKPGDSLKFDTNGRPEYITPQQHKDAKQDLIVRLRDIGVRMIVYVILHDISVNEPYDTRMNYALNTLVYAYDDLLFREHATGLMLIDRDNGRYDHLEYLFQHGLNFEGRQVPVNARIRLFGQTNDNASHLSSATDVALGAFRYCVNAAGGWGRNEVASAMFPPLGDMMWGIEVTEGIKQVRGFGYHPRPHSVKVQRYSVLYETLANALATYSND
jgi:hypothetical protein